MTANPPLDGIRVLDLSRVLAGPWASQTLADLGASVIKVERPGVGDDTRAWGPPFFTDAAGDTFSAYYLSANRGKQSVCIDLASSEGADLVRQLVAGADILIENYKYGDMAKRGLDYDALSKDNPRIIYCSITGFGQTGPYRQRPGYDFMIQGMGGLMSITGDPAQGDPQKVGVALADILTGLYSTIAILGALEERHTSGVGQYIDMALLDVLTASLANQASNYLVSGVAPQRLGNAHPNVVPYQTFGTSDGYIIVAVGNDAQFRKLCHALDRQALAEDPRFTTNASRVEHRDVLASVVQDAMADRTSEDWLATLEAAGVPCGPINSIDKVFADPQVQARGMSMDIDGVPLVANPIHYSRSNLNYATAPPALGEDTDQVLRDVANLTEEQIRLLRGKGIIS